MSEKHLELQQSWIPFFRQPPMPFYHSFLFDAYYIGVTQTREESHQPFTPIPALNLRLEMLTPPCLMTLHSCFFFFFLTCFILWKGKKEEKKSKKQEEMYVHTCMISTEAIL